MYKIRDWLYISSFPIASNYEAVKKAGIQAMLLVYKDIKHPDIAHLFLPLMEGIPISEETIARGMNFIKEHQQRGQRVMISCAAGISRSVTFATAALKEIESLSLRDAFMAIRARNREALPDHVHWQSLIDYYGGGIDYWKLFEEIIDLN